MFWSLCLIFWSQSETNYCKPRTIFIFGSSVCHSVTRIVSHRFLTMYSLVSVAMSSFITVTLILANNSCVQSACDKIPWLLTLEEPDCAKTTLETWACLGDCHSWAKPVPSYPFFRHETGCCAAARFNSTTVYFRCRGGTLKARRVDIIEECTCRSCTAETRHS